MGFWCCVVPKFFLLMGSVLLAQVKKMQDLVKVVQEGLNNGDPLVIGLLVAFMVVALTILILAVRGGSNKRRGVLLVGLCDAGKTLIYTRLVNKKYAQSHTSITENNGLYELPNGKSLRMIDLPGHERIRMSMVDQFKNMARGLVFVVDSLTFQKEIKDVAEFLYTLLTDSVLASNIPPVLIVCNKMDQALAKGARVIQAQLEKEINTVRVTRSAALNDQDNSSANNNAFLGKRDKNFTFTDAKPFRISFVECSARGEKEGGEADLQQLEAWLQKLA